MLNPSHSHCSGWGKETNYEQFVRKNYNENLHCFLRKLVCYGNNFLYHSYRGCNTELRSFIYQEM